MKSKVIEDIATRFQWEEKKTKKAINELLLQESIADLGEFLNIFLNSTNPETRLIATSDYIFNNSKYDLVDSIEKMLFKTDPCFRTLVVFNYYDLLEDLRKNREEYHHFDIKTAYRHLENEINNGISWEINNGIKSFIHWVNVLKVTLPSIRYRSSMHDPRLSPDELQDEVIDIIVNKMCSEKGIELNELLLKIASRTGFLAFNIQAFRYLSSGFIYNPILRDNASELASALINPIDFANSTNRKHWLIYVLAEKLQNEKGCKVRESFYYIGELFNIPENTIARRFYEKYDAATVNKFELEEVIDQNRLHMVVNQYLDDFDDRKEELKIKRKKSLSKKRKKKKQNKN